MPAYNEAETIGRLIEAVFTNTIGTNVQINVIVVDDGSSDATTDVVKRMAARYSVSLLKLTRNFGKEAALLAGLDHADGDAVVIMDADLQHPVELIRVFLTYWRRGYQCVYAVRENRRDESLAKRWATKLFYSTLNHGSKNPIEPNALDFRLLDKTVVRALTSMRERVRFTKGLFAWVGYRSIGVPFMPDPRFAGTSRFNMRSLARLGWDGITSFSDLPLRLFAAMGASIAGVAILYASYIALRTIIFGVEVPGWATLTVAIMFLSGVQMLFLGIIGEYVRNIFLESKARPNYLVSEFSTHKAVRRQLPIIASVPARDDSAARRLGRPIRSARQSNQPTA